MIHKNHLIKSHQNMAATSGPYGSRKSLSDVFPRLTGKSVMMIYDQMYNIDHDRANINRIMHTYEENVFLTGLLLCNLWKNNEEDIIDTDHYDISFAGAGDDLIECVKMYLRKYNVDDDRIDQLVESTLRQGYTTYDPVPYTGKLSITGIEDEGQSIGKIIDKMFRDDIDQYVRVTNPLYGNHTKMGQILFAITDKNAVSWDGLIMSLVENRSNNDNSIDMDEIIFLNRILDITSDDLETTVKHMILKRDITDNNDKIVGTIELIQD
jgi:hypothetical protein